MKSKKIIPHGFGFWFTIIILTVFMIVSILGMIGIFFPFTEEYYYNWTAFAVMFIFFIISCSLVIKYIKKNGVIFEKENIIIESVSDISIYQSTKQNCKDFISFELKYRKLLLCLEFTMINSEKIYFAVTQYTNRQLLKILQEIKNRGGFPNQEIEIHKTSFKKMIE